MGKSQKKLHLKRFLKHYRAERPDDELMHIHGLSPRALHKVLQVALERGLLTQAELRPHHRLSLLQDDQTEPSTTGPLIVSESGPVVEDTSTSVGRDYMPEPPHEKPQREEPAPGESVCPQCQAPVGLRTLICPECGHVLPGEQRWEKVEPKKRLVDRVPPWIWGFILAVPIAILLFFFFRDFMLPSAEQKIEKRLERFRQRNEAGRPPARPGAEVSSAEVQESLRRLDMLVRRLIREERLSSVDEQYSLFTTGIRWDQLTKGQRRALLVSIREIMIKAELSASFRVIDPWGAKVAVVEKDVIHLYDPLEPESAAPPAEQAPAPEKPEPNAAPEK